MSASLRNGLNRKFRRRIQAHHSSSPSKTKNVSNWQVIHQEDHLPSAPMHATLPLEPLSALDAAYAMLPENEKVDLRVAATAHLLQQGYKREFLIEPVMMSAVYTLLAARHTTQPIEAGNSRTQVPSSRG